MAKTTGLIDAQGNPLRARASQRPVARYMRDTSSGVIASRMVPLVESRDDIRASWQRSAALALDLIKNSGRLRGAADQVIADTVGTGLKLSPTPDFTGMGWSDDQIRDWKKIVKKRWARYRTNAKEVDFRGKFSLSQLTDIALRYNMAYGEVTGLLEYMPASVRRRYGIKTGTKLCLIPPHRLVQDTNQNLNLFQGVYLDDNGRPIGYLFQDRENGLISKTRYNAFDQRGRAAVLHVFDPQDALDVRGISVLASAFRSHIQHEKLNDVTLQTSILQNLFAITLTSDKPTMEAFEALETLKSENVAGADAYAKEYVDYLKRNLESAAENEIKVSDSPQISQLVHGEELKFQTSGIPGPQYFPLSSDLSRITARAIGITYGSFTLDHSSATYSSVRMDNSSIWPVVERRRDRCAVPVERPVYEGWLDEEIFTGAIPFKDGYRAFDANREAILPASLHGPAKPTADDGKSAKAASERLENGTSSVELESADLGIDSETLFEQRLELHRRYVDAGMDSPYARRGRGMSEPKGDAAPEQEDPQS